MTYGKIANILVRASVDSPSEAKELQKIKEALNIQRKAVEFAIDYFFNNDNYPNEYYPSDVFDNLLN